MKTRALRHQLLLGATVVAICSLLMALSSLRWSVSAWSQKRPAVDDERRSRQAGLKLRLASRSAAEFHSALSALTALDEPGTLDVWRAALDNQDPGFRRDAWREYRAVQSRLARREFVPQIARVSASAEEVLKIARSSGLEANIWMSNAIETFAAAPPYLNDRLRSAGIETQVVYDSVAEWQKAKGGGDVVAQAITPTYQTAEAEADRQIRIAVIDLADQVAPAPGYSDWLGDGENILMRDGSRIAYLDVFHSDGAAASITTHIAEQFTNRGYKVMGSFTPKEFERVAPQLFSGKSFNAGRTGNSRQGNVARLALANGAFHSYEQTLSEFRSLETSYPTLAQYSTLGTSFEGREIFALKITKNPAVNDITKPDVLITGCYHAREWISVET